MKTAHTSDQNMNWGRTTSGACGREPDACVTTLVADVDRPEQQRPELVRARALWRQQRLRRRWRHAEGVTWQRRRDAAVIGDRSLVACPDDPNSWRIGVDRAVDTGRETAGKVELYGHIDDPW